MTPDICLYSKMYVNLQEDLVRMTDLPFLAVEIASPSLSTQDVVDKINDMLDAGVESCWLVQPAMETITVYTANSKPVTVSDGTLTDSATDIEVAVDDLFADG